MAKRDFDAFYYGVGMKLDDKSVEQAAEKLEGRLNQVVDNVTKEVKKIALAVNSGIKDIDTTGLNKAIKEVGMDLDDLVDFDPKKLKTQVGRLESDFKGLSSQIGDMSSKMANSFDSVNDLITKVSTRLENIEIKTSKDGIRAFKSDLEMMADYAQKMLNSGEIDASGVDKYLQRVKNGFASLKASGNPLEMFADKDIAKYFVNISTLLRDMGTPVEDLRVEFFELSSVFKEVFESTNLPGAQNVFKGVKYQIEEANHALQKARLNISEYEAEIAKLENSMRDWHKIANESDQTLIDAFQSEQTIENLDAIIKKIEQYQQKIYNAPKNSPDLQSYERLISLAQTAEGIMSGIGKRKSKPFITKWAEELSYITDADELKNYKINDVSVGFLESYREALQKQIDGIRNAPEYQELQKIIGEQTITLERLVGKKSSKTTAKKGTNISQTTGEKFVVSPELKIDAKKWTTDINTALQNISGSGKLKPVDLRINTQSKKITEDLNTIRTAIENTLSGTRGSRKKDEQGDPVSTYMTSFDKSFKEFNTKLTKAKTDILKIIKDDWQPALKDAFKFQMTVDGQSKIEAQKQVGAFIQTYINALNEAFKDRPIELTSNIDQLIEKIKSQVKDIKIEGEVSLTPGDINKSGLDINANTSGLAQDSTVKQIYNLLASRGGSVYTGVPIYMGATPTIGGTPTDVKIVETKAKAEEKGADAVKKKVEAEQKAADTIEAKTQKQSKKSKSEKVSQPTKSTEEKTTKKDENGFNKQQIYNEVHHSIKKTLQTFKDSETAFAWVAEEAKKYSETLKTADKNSEEFFKAEVGLTSLLHQWRSKIGLPKSAEAFKYEKNLGFKGRSGNANWTEYLKQYGITELFPKDFKLLKETKFREEQGLDEPKSPGRQSSQKKSQKIEEIAEEMIARDFEHTKQITEHVLKMAKWAKALGTIADGLDYTITEADFKNRDTITRNGVTWTEADLYEDGRNGEIFSEGNRLTSKALDEFVAEYENSEDEEFKELFAFIKKLIEVQRASQSKLDAVLKDLDGTDVATKYGDAKDKSEYLAKNIKSYFGRLMGKNANKDAQISTLEVLSRYGMLESFQKLSTEKNPEEIFKTLQDNVLNNANIDKMIGELSALDGNVGKTYENFINLLKIAKEFMLTSNSIQTIGQEARNWIGGTKEQRNKYKKELDPKTGRVITTDEVIGVENKVIENGLRQMIQEFKAIFINDAGERAFGFNDGKNIVGEFLGGGASFTKIIDFLERALEEAVDIQLAGNKGVAKDYVGVRKHERIANIVDASAVPTYATGIIKKTESETIAQQIKRSQEQKQKAEEDLNRLRTELNEAVSDAEMVSKILDISEQKDVKNQSIIAQKNKIDGIQNNIQTLEKQLTTPAEAFESIQTQLLQKQEALLDMQKKFNSMPNATENDRDAKEKLKEQISKEQSAIARLQEKARDAQRTYEEGVANRLIEEQTLNIASLEQMVTEKSANKDIADKRAKVESLTGSRQKILDQIANTSDELANIKPQLSSAQQELVQKYEGYIGNTNEKIKTILETIKELEEKGVPKDDNNLIVATNELERLEAHKKRIQDLINKEKSAPKGAYTQEQLVVRQQKEAELTELRKQSAAIWTEEQPLVAEIASYDKEIKFLQDTIATKKKYIESLRSGLNNKRVMSTPDEIQAQLDAKTQELAQAQSEQEKLQAEYATIQGSEDEIVNRELEILRSRKAEKDARIKEIDAIKDSANNAELQNERKGLETAIAQIDNHINEGLVRTIIRIKSELVATQDMLNRASADLVGQEARLKKADNSTPTYTKGGKLLHRADAEGLLPQAQSRLDYEIKQIDTVLNAYLLQKTEALTELTVKAVGGEINPNDAKNLKTEMVNIKTLSDNLASGKIKEEEYVNKVTAAYVAMQKVIGEVNEAAARSNAKQLKDAIVNKQRLEEEITLLNEIVALEEKTSATPVTTTAQQTGKTKPQVVVQPEIQPGEVAEEVRENVAQAPATVAVQPTMVTDDSYASSGYAVQAILGGQGLATESNQQTIIDLLKSGIKVNGKVTASKGDTTDTGSSEDVEKETTPKETKKKTPKIPSTGRVDAQADEINKLTNINKNSNVYKRYESMMAQLNDALKQAEDKGDTFATKDADRIRGLMTNISGLGRKIIEASGAFEQLRERGVSTTEYIEDGVKSLEAEMLNMAHSDALSKNALISDVSYDDVKQRMTYVLTDLEGSTTRVTMAYNEMFGSIVTTADKTTDSVRKVYRSVEGEMTKMVQSGNLVDDLMGNPTLKNSSEYTTYAKTYENMMKVANNVRAKGTLATQQEKNELIALVKQVETARIAFEKLAKASADFDNKVGQNFTKVDNFDSLEMQMKNFVLASQPWTAAQRKMIEDTWKFSDAQNSATYSVEKNKGQLASMSVVADAGTKRIGQYTQETKKYQSGMEKFMDSLKNKWQEVARYLMTFGSMYRVFAMLKQGIQYVKEIDSALTELKKVTDETEESYDRFLNTAAKTADKVGSTIKEIVSSTADWARIGYNLQEAATLAESTAVLLNVSEFQSIDEATSALTSTLQAFSYTADQSMDVVDVLNEVGKIVARR